MDPAQDYQACAHAENVHCQPISRHGREMGSQRVLQMHELTIRAIAHNDYPRVVSTWEIRRDRPWGLVGSQELCSISKLI